MKRLIFPGSFNPVTFGHLHIIERAAKLCQQLTIAVYETPAGKSSLLPLALRLQMMRKAVESIPNTSVVSFSGLVVDCANEHEAEAIIRGVRDSSDWIEEQRLAQANAKLAGIETLLLPTEPQFVHLKASWLQDIARHAPAKLEQFMPKGTAQLFSDFIQSH